jgi:hypothetical protein
MEILFCKIYVLVALPKQAVLELLVELTKGDQIGSTIETPWGVLDLLKNDESDLTKVSGPDAFLFFPYFVDIEPARDVNRGKYVKEIGNLLLALWNKKIAAVAASDFECELPRKGGFQ